MPRPTDERVVIQTRLKVAVQKAARLTDPSLDPQHAAYSESRGGLLDAAV
jgi:hypothetical protein